MRSVDRNHANDRDMLSLQRPHRNLIWSDQLEPDDTPLITFEVPDIEPDPMTERRGRRDAEN